MQYSMFDFRMASQALQSTVSEVQSILRLVAASPEKYTGPVAQATPAQAEVRHSKPLTM